MEVPPPRIVTLVLVDSCGSVLGALAPFAAETPWWMDMEPVVRAVLQRDGVRVVVLRLLGAERPRAHGGAVTYLAQLEGPAQAARLEPWAGTLLEHALRHSYARVGGPHADLAWAATVLQAHGSAIVGEPRQIRTWNLSSIWRLRTTLGTAWLKVVPPFFAHEADILVALVEARVPRLLGHEGGRMLSANIDGSDRYDAAPSECLAMIDLLVSIQRDWLGRAEELLCIGAPDWRGPALSSAIGALVARRADELGPGVHELLEGFVAGLPARFAAITACGLPDGLVHGDFHPGNFRGTASRLNLLDWGDSGIGHPLLDQTAFLDRIPETQGQATRQHWAEAWRRVVPGADVETASHLLVPIAAARQAVIYQRFLDAIEDAEHPYHRADVGIWLQRAADRLTSAAL